MKICNLIKLHKVALFVGILISLTYGSFHFFMSREVTRLGYAYAPVSVEGNFDEGYYALRAAKAYAGKIVIGDINLVEYEDSPAFLPILNPHVLGTLGKIAGSMDRAFVLSDLFFPSLIFLLIYLLTLEIGIPKGASIALAAFFMIAPKFALFPAPAALPFFSSARDLYFSRFDYPNVTFIFFAATLYFMTRTVMRQERKTAWLLGIFSGLLFYTYLYDWVYIFTSLGLLILLFWWQGDQERLKLTLTALTIGLFISIPYWLNTQTLIALPSYPDLSERIGLEHGRQFRFAIVWPSYLRNLGLLMLLCLSGFLRKRKHLLAFFASLLLPILILLNIQIVTGFVPHPDHWHRTQFLTLALSLAYMLSLVHRAYQGAFSVIPPKVLKTLVIMIISGSLGYGIWVNMTLAKEKASSYAREPEHAAAYAWLRENTPRHSVVGTISARANDEIILYTDNKIFLPNGLHTVAPTAEIWQRARLLARLMGLSPDSFKTLVQKQTLYLFTDFYRRDKSFNSYLKRTVREIPSDILEKETGLFSQTDPSVTPYLLDYVLIDDRARALGADEKMLPRSTLQIYKNQALSIYAL